MIGVLQVLGDEIGCFNPEDQAFLESLGATAAIAIENARLYAEEQERADTLARALAQQRELDRLKSEFIQNVSHELRTPLGIVRGYAELLDSGQLGELEPGQKEAVSVMVRRMQGLNRLVDDINAILEVETQDIQPALVDLAQVVQGLLDGFQAAVERGGLSLKTQFEPGLPPILGHPDHLVRVVDNLLRNAIKFTPGGGCVSLRLWQEGQSVVLEVADTGVGIPPDQLGRIFDRFYQGDGSTTRRHGGTGLGLALVKEIVLAHRGEVSVNSKLDEGSTVRVTLPVAPADEVQNGDS
jgi:signal transduction histidine kinase